MTRPLRHFDEVLGELVEAPGESGVFVGIVHRGTNKVELRVESDGHELSACVELARRVIFSLSDLEAAAKTAIAQELLETYNENWREYWEADGNGGWKDVSNPELDERSFTEAMTLESITIAADEICSLIYRDGGLFEGHFIDASVFDTTQLTDFHVNLVG